MSRFLLVPFLVYRTYDIYVLLRITVHAYVHVHTHVGARCVCTCVYKSDLIEPDDSSANTRALTANAQTFIAFEVDATRGHRTILGRSNPRFSRNPRISTLYFSHECPVDK